MKGHVRSFVKPKDLTKSTIEKKNAEEDEFKKYDAIINKLAQAVIFKDKPSNQTDNDFSSSKRNPSVATRSNIKMTVSRTKDERNDKDFLNNLMNSDSTSSVPPKNLHLLSDDDRNKSITSTEKFKNLSDLMVDDRNSFSECYFIKNSEDRMMLNLYTILGRKSKELFLEEDDKENLIKTRLLFNKINNIKFPKFEFETKKSSEKSCNEELEQTYKGLEEEINTEIKSDISEEKKEEKIELYSEEEKVKNKEECYFKKKEKPSFIIPDLVDIPTYNKIKRIIKQRNRENYDNFWDPEIDANTLSHINHNMVCIEDIYNEKEEKVENEEENNDEDKDIEIDAEEIKSSDSESEEEKENKGDMKDTDDILKKGKIRFIEFCEVSPVQMGLSYIVDPNKIKEKIYNLELKERADLQLDKINEFEEKVFPRQGYKLSNELIYKIAVRNDNNEIEEIERFTINPFQDKYMEHKRNIKKQSKKIIVERKANLQPLQGKLTEEPFTLKKTNKNEFKSISDYANKNNGNNNYILDKQKKEKFEDEEKMKNDSSIKIENQEDDENENTLKDLINNETLFSNKFGESKKNNNQQTNKKKDEINNQNDEPSYNTSNSNSQEEPKSKNNEILYSDKDKSSHKIKNSQSDINSSSQLF